MISIGTSGFLFDDWRGPVFPADLPRREWLPYYERVLGFRALELNATFYTLVSAPAIARMIERTSPAFRFVVKAHHSITHGPPDLRTLDRFRGTLELFRDAGRFAGTLLQFPPRFQPTPRSVAALEALRHALGDPLFVEFRHLGWHGSFIRNRLADAGLACCAVDLPRLRPLPRFEAVATAGTACLRLHGRNPSWYERPDLRYDWRYSDAELAEIAAVARKLKEVSRQVMVFFNNCRSGHAAQDAIRLAGMLG